MTCGDKKGRGAKDDSKVLAGDDLVDNGCHD